jgi:hypothetical protein
MSSVLVLFEWIVSCRGQAEKDRASASDRSVQPSIAADRGIAPPSSAKNPFKRVCPCVLGVTPLAHLPGCAGSLNPQAQAARSRVPTDPRRRRDSSEMTDPSPRPSSTVPDTLLPHKGELALIESPDKVNDGSCVLVGTKRKERDGNAEVKVASVSEFELEPAIKKAATIAPSDGAPTTRPAKHPLSYTTKAASQAAAERDGDNSNHAIGNRITICERHSPKPEGRRERTSQIRLGETSKGDRKESTSHIDREQRVDVGPHVDGNGDVVIASHGRGNADMDAAPGMASSEEKKSAASGHIHVSNALDTREKSQKFPPRSSYVDLTPYPGRLRLVSVPDLPTAHAEVRKRATRLVGAAEISEMVKNEDRPKSARNGRKSKVADDAPAEQLAHDLARNSTAHGVKNGTVQSAAKGDALGTAIARGHSEVDDVSHPAAGCDRPNEIETSSVARCSMPPPVSDAEVPGVKLQYSILLDPESKDWRDVMVNRYRTWCKRARRDGVRCDPQRSNHRVSCLALFSCSSVLSCVGKKSAVRACRRRNLISLSIANYAVKVTARAFTSVIPRE